MYRYFHGADRDSIPFGLPARLIDPTLRVLGEQPQFLRIGEGNHPRNELLRKVYQQPSKDVVRTKVLSDIYPPTEKEAYLARPENIAAIRTASEQLGIPLERTGLRIATNPFRLEGDITNVNAATELIGKASSNLAKQGKPVFYDALTRKAKFFNQPTSHSEIAVDGTEGFEAILEAYEKAELRRTALSQGNRPILPQADGLNPNISIPTGSPENIPPMDIEGMKGANRYVDVSQGLETARVIQYPNIYDRLNNGAQPTVTPTIPYSADIPTAIGDSILSPKVSIEIKRPRFIDTGEGRSLASQVALLRRATNGLKVQGDGVVNLLDLVKAKQAKGTGIFTRQGERINAEQRSLLDTGMADLEDRSFILQDPSSVNRTEQYRATTRLAEPLPTMLIDPAVLDNTNTYGKSQGRTPWREYYSDPFVYEDKGLDGEVNRLMKAVNEAPAQLENAYTQQALANRRAIDASNKLKLLGGQVPVRYGLLPQGEGVVNLAREVRKDRRMAEINAAKATDTIAQLKAAQELMGVEYMVKPKGFSPNVMEGYRIASQNKGAIKNQETFDYSTGRPVDPVDYEDAMESMGITGSRNLWRDEPDRDYDIATLFGFTGNY